MKEIVMGRSVSFASGSEVILYAHVDAVYDDEGNFDDFLSQLAWDDAIENLSSGCLEAFPSLEVCDEWLDREDHAILENKLLYIGVSEYCGLVSIWVVPKDNEYYALGVASANNMKAKLEQVVQEAFGVRLNQIGRFSNGEALFQAA
jgi:hypothetical protein